MNSKDQAIVNESVDHDMITLDEIQIKEEPMDEPDRCSTTTDEPSTEVELVTVKSELFDASETCITYGKNENHAYNMAENTRCAVCKTTYSSVSNLRKHARRFHPHHSDVLAPLMYKKSKNFQFTCACGRNFNQKRNLVFHQKMHITETTQEKNKIPKELKKCPMCGFRTASKQAIIHHYTNAHDIDIKKTTREMSTMDEFYSWKEALETDTKSRFRKYREQDSNHHMSINFICCRSGNYIPRGKGARHLKSNGSKKINGYCPANIQCLQQRDGGGGIKVEFFETHIGHEPDIGHLTLTLSERKKLASQIASKVPFDDILDKVHNSIYDENLKRVHLLTKKDLFNIEASFNLQSTAVRHSNDVISVDSWVNEMRQDEDCVVYYKAQGAASDELKDEDFALIIMTSAQCDLLKKYGSDCICFDGTHGFNNYEFELNTLLVLDDLGEGFPAAFLISNRSDIYMLTILFSQIKKCAGIITPKVFMSDLKDSFYNAWLETMGKPEQRIFCTWHVDCVWRKNLSKLKSKETQVAVYKQLRSLLEEKDLQTFEKKLHQFCDRNDPGMIAFIKYFKQHYSGNSSNWAHCYRQYSSMLNTSMHVERVHKTIKDVYLKIKRPDKAIAAIMTSVRDRLIDRLIVISKGKVFTKLETIRSRHTTSLSMNPSMIIPRPNGWELPSANNKEMHLIQENTTTCNCKLTCPECKICIHKYTCSCMDASIKFNMCQHIHLLVQFRNNCNESQSLKHNEHDNLSMDR